MRWLWGHIYTETDYKTAMSDSDCFNMFLEALMERMSVIGVWGYRGNYRVNFPLGTFIPNGRGGPSTQYQYGWFSAYRIFGRDWYKAFADINLRVGEGWPLLQSIVMDIRKFFVRCRDENGPINTLDGMKVVPGWDSMIYYQAKELDDDTVTYSRQKIETPSDGWHRKYHRTIKKLSSPGKQGWIARLDPTPPAPAERDKDNEATNLWGMRNWIFKFDAGKWQYAPHNLDVDLLERHGAIQKCDRIGPWILNDLKQAIDDLWWTYATSHYGDAGPVAPINLQLDRSKHFRGFDKIEMSNSQSMAGQVNTNNTATGYTTETNRYELEIATTTIKDDYFENRHYPGVYPSDTYNIGIIATNAGIINIPTPGDPTGENGSYPYPSNFSYSGSWNQGITWYNPAKYLQYSEGISRTIDYYTAATNFLPLKFVTFESGSSWSDFSQGGAGRAGIIKWDFKYGKNKNTSTWQGFPNALRWSN